MKSTSTFILLSFIFLQYSCKTPNEYEVGKHKLQIEIPNSFTETSIGEADKFSEDGIELFEQEGYTGFSDQKSIFFFQKGEFNLLKAKKYKLDQNIIKNYNNQWNNMKGVLYDVLVKKTLEMEGVTIDSLSAIKIINGIEFYVFETNVYLLDLNNTKTQMKSLRYSTPVDNQDLVIDASFINQADGIEVYKSLNSINIVK